MAPNASATLYNLVEKKEWPAVLERLQVAEEAELFYSKAVRDAAGDRTVLQLAAALSAPPEVIAGLVSRAGEVAGREVYVNQKNRKSYWTALHFAIYHRASLPTIKALFENGAFAVAPDDNGRTPLHLLMEDFGSQTIQVLKLLLQNGSQTLIGDVNGRTPLHNALRWDKEQSAMSLLLTHAFEKDRDSPLLLTLAIAGKQFVLAERLVREGASVISKDEFDGRTALHWAAEKMCNSDLVKMLLERGADTETLDNEGETPKAIAARIGNQLFLKTLEEIALERTSQKRIKELAQSLETARLELHQQQLIAAEAELVRLTQEKSKAKKRVARAEAALTVKMESLAECRKRVAAKTKEVAQLKASAPETLPEALICHICVTNKRNRVLNCGHTFCSNCVEKLRGKCSYCNVAFTKSKPLFLG